MASSKKSGSSELAADVSFLEQNQQNDGGGVQELHKSQLLRVEVEELLKECRLPLSLHGPAPVDEVKWASTARQYATTIEQLILKFQISEIAESDSSSSSSSFLFPLVPPEWDATKFQSVRLLPSGHDEMMMTKKKSKSPVFQLHMKPASNGALLSKAGNALVVSTLEYLVVLPNAMFHSKDYRNGRYFYKRNAVIQQVAQYLTRKSKVVGRVFWRLDQGDVKRPMLLLYPPAADNQTKKNKHKDDSSSNRKRSHQDASTNSGKSGKIRFRLALSFVMESADWMPTPLRLLPDRSNLGSDSATPHYNQTLAWESCQVAIHSILSGVVHHHHNTNEDGEKEDHAADIMSPHVQHALVLIQVWSLQRGLVRGEDTWSPTIMAILVLYMLRTRRCHARMSPLQIVTALFQFIRDTDWIGEQSTTTTANDNATTTSTELLRSSPSEAYQDRGFNQAKFQKRAALVMPLSGKTVAQTIELSELAQSYQPQTAHKREPKLPPAPITATSLLECFQRYTSGPILLDPTMSVNYLYRLSPSFVREWQFQANRSLHLLHSVSRPVPALFTTNARFWTRYDLFCYLSPWQSLVVPSTKPARSEESSSKSNMDVDQDETMDFVIEDVGVRDAMLRRLDHLLRRALGDRILSMRAWTTGNGHVSDSDRPGEDSDEIPTHAVMTNAPVKSALSTGTAAADRLVLGFTLNPDTCHRLVDRGPPADDATATQRFLKLWGQPKAQLRRFQDGAIVYAVVWNGEDSQESTASSPPSLANDDRMQGGIVQKIVRHIVHLHFTKQKQTKKKDAKHGIVSTTPLQVSFSLPHLLSVVDGVKSSSSDVDNKNRDSHQLLQDPVAAQRLILNAFDALSSFLRLHSVPTLPIPGTVDQKKSRLGLPLAIDAVEPLSPALRYSELFPPLPHSLLGDTSFTLDGSRQVAAGVITSAPIIIQIRFGQSSKWPTDLKAIAAAKTAMLVQLANGIDGMKHEQGGNELCSGFHLPSLATPTYLDLRFKGYLFRVVVRADAELHLLRNLQKPSMEASSLLQTLTKEHVVAAMHHSTIHAVHTMHPSASTVVRLVKRWMAAHMLSGHIPIEAVELIVAKLYADQNDTCLGSPTTAVSGFMRFLNVLSTFDWARRPLIVNPQGHITEADREAIYARFDQSRGPNFENGPPMYIISPNDRQTLDSEPTAVQSYRQTDTALSWAPAFTRQTPEWVVLSRASALAARTYELLHAATVAGKPDTWTAIFHESATSFEAYDVLLRVDPDLIIDTESSSRDGDLLVRSKVNGYEESSFTRSLRSRYLGPRQLRRKTYRNLQGLDDDVLLEWKPIDELVNVLREKLTTAVLFYNELSPDIIAVLWRPSCLSHHSLSVMMSENVRPVDKDKWKGDSHVSTNIHDILRDLSQLTTNVITAVRVVAGRQS